METHLFGSRLVRKRAFWVLAASGFGGRLKGIFRALVWLIAASFAVQTGVAASKPAKSGRADDFMPYVQLEPFVVNGKQLAISIHARSEKDRRYAADFAEEVVKVVYEGGVTSETGKGLVIIGKKGEPHPIFVFRKFQALRSEERRVGKECRAGWLL